MCSVCNGRGYIDKAYYKSDGEKMGEAIDCVVCDKTGKEKGKVADNIDHIILHTYYKNDDIFKKHLYIIIKNLDSYKEVFKKYGKDLVVNDD